MTLSGAGVKISGLPPVASLDRLAWLPSIPPSVPLGPPTGRGQYGMLSVKLPTLLELDGSLTVLEMGYDPITDSYVAIGSSVATKYDGGSQGALTNVFGGTAVNNLCIIPGTGKAFIGCGSQKLCILDLATMSYDVTLLQQDYDYGSGMVHASLSAQVIYSPSEDVVYGFGPGGSGLANVTRFHKTAGTLLTGIHVWSGSGAGSLQDHDGSMAYNPADGNMYWADNSSPMSLGKIDHVTHAVTHTLTAITAYDTNGSIIFDSAGNLYVLASNQSPALLHKCSAAGAIVSTIKLGLAGDSVMTYDGVANRLYCNIGPRIFVVDLNVFACLGAVVLGASGHRSMPLDPVRNKLVLALNSSGYAFLQL